jgi:hypothetical protein
VTIVKDRIVSLAGELQSHNPGNAISDRFASAIAKGCFSFCPSFFHSWECIDRHDAPTPRFAEDRFRVNRLSHR